MCFHEYALLVRKSRAGLRSSAPLQLALLYVGGVDEGNLFLTGIVGERVWTCRPVASCNFCILSHLDTTVSRPQVRALASRICVRHLASARAPASGG